MPTGAALQVVAANREAAVKFNDVVSWIGLCIAMAIVIASLFWLGLLPAELN